MLATAACSSFESYMLLIDRVISHRFRTIHGEARERPSTEQRSSHTTAWDRAIRAFSLRLQRLEKHCPEDAHRVRSVLALSSLRPRSPILKGLLFSGREFEREFVEYLQKRGHEIVYCHTLADTLRAMEQGVAIIAQAPFAHELLHGRADLLIREWVQSTGDGTAPLEPPWNPFNEPSLPSTALPPGSQWIATVPRADWSTHLLYRYTACECKLAQQVHVQFPIQAMAYLWMIRSMERRLHPDLDYWPRFYLCLDINADAHVGQVLCKRTVEYSFYFEVKLEELISMVRYEGASLLAADLLELPKRITDTLSDLDMLVDMRESRRKLTRFAYTATIIERHHQSLLLVAEMRPADARLLHDRGIRRLSELASLTVGEHGCMEGIPEWRLTNYVHQARLLVRKFRDGGQTKPLHEQRASAARAVERLLPPPSPMDMYLVYMSSYDQFYFLLGTWCTGREPRSCYFWASTTEEAASLLQRFLKRVQVALREDPCLHIYHFGALDRHALMEVALATHDADIQAAVESLPLVDLRHVFRACLYIGHEDPYTLWSLERVVRSATKTADDIPISPQLQAAELYENYRVAERYRKTSRVRMLRHKILSQNIRACQLLEEAASWLRRCVAPELMSVSGSHPARHDLTNRAKLAPLPQHDSAVSPDMSRGTTLHESALSDSSLRPEKETRKNGLNAKADAQNPSRRVGELWRAPLPSTPFAEMMQMLHTEHAVNIPENDAMLLSLQVRKDLAADDPMRDLVDYIRRESKITFQYLRWRQRPEIALDVDFYDDPDVIVDAVVVEQCQETESAFSRRSLWPSGSVEGSTPKPRARGKSTKKRQTSAQGAATKAVLSDSETMASISAEEPVPTWDGEVAELLQKRRAHRSRARRSSLDADTPNSVEPFVSDTVEEAHFTDSSSEASEARVKSVTGELSTPSRVIRDSQEERVSSRVERLSISVRFPAEQRIYPETGQWQVSVLVGDTYILVPSARLRFTGPNSGIIEVERTLAQLYFAKGTRLPRIVRRPVAFRRLSAILGLCAAAVRPEHAVLASRYLRRMCPFPELAHAAEPYRSAENIAAVVESLRSISDGRIVLIQGPPGTGKTYTIAECIGSLLMGAFTDGRPLRIGVSANAHAAIDNALTAVLHFLHKQGIKDTARYVWRIGQRKQCSLPEGSVRLTSRSPTRAELDDEVGPRFILAGTAFALSHVYLRGVLDYLFVDEAGQLPRAYFVSMLPNVRYAAVLVGDQMQLSAVSANGSLLPSRRPLTGGESCLTYLVGSETSVIGPEWGWFLPTSRRLNPSLCQFISTTFYDGQLRWHPSAETHCVWDLQQGRARSGLGFLAIDATWSPDFDGSEALLTRWKRQVGAILKLVMHFTQGSRYRLCLSSDPSVDAYSALRSITMDDILIVAPYNEQVTALQTAFLHWVALNPPSSASEATDEIPGTLCRDSRQSTGASLAGNIPLIGTVDKFQGQERPIAILSLCTPEWETDSEADAANATRSSANHESIAFVLDSRRLNVALSRAQCLAIVVGDGRLDLGAARQVESLVSMNLFLRLRAQATTWTWDDLKDGDGWVSAAAAHDSE
jgi:hypothetical protein